MGFPGGSEGKASACSVGDQGSIPGSGRSPGEGNGNPFQYSCLGNFHGWRSLVGYSPWGCKESDTTERLHFHFQTHSRLLGRGNPHPIPERALVLTCVSGPDLVPCQRTGGAGAGAGWCSPPVFIGRALHSLFIWRGSPPPPPSPSSSPCLAWSAGLRLGSAWRVLALCSVHSWHISGILSFSGP